MYLTYVNPEYSENKVSRTIDDSTKYILSGGTEGFTEVWKNPKKYITRTVEPKTLKFFADSFNTTSLRLLTQLINLRKTIYSFLEDHPDFLENKEKYYKFSRIPKKKKNKVRLISEPMPELKELQRTIRLALQNSFRLLPHNCAHAYIENRDYVTNGKEHERSRHIVAMDFKDFFPSINSEMIKMILPQLGVFSAKGTQSQVRTLVDAIIDVATLDDGLPQGSPLSPYLSNLIMIPFDYHLTEILVKNEEKFSPATMIYTRYADDIFISSRRGINLDKIMNTITKLTEINTPGLLIHPDKTKYLKTSGKVFITGVKINKDHQTTIGHEKKKAHKNNLHHLFMALQNNELNDYEVQEVLGYHYGFFQRVEPEYAKYVESKYLRLFNSPHTTLNEHFKLGSV